VFSKYFGSVAMPALIAATQSCSLRGISLSTTNLIFAPEVVDQVSNEKTLTVRNFGTIAAPIKLIGSGPYSIVNGCPARVVALSRV
jgi:hypothetical protein